MARILSVYAVAALVSFLLHLVWERAHIVLYRGYEALEGPLPVYLYATFGDVMYTLLAFIGLSLVLGYKVVQAPGMREYVAFAVIGLCIALFVEVKAQMLGRWEYTEAMPILWGFGLSPLIQMTVLLPLTVSISTAIVRRFVEHS